MQIISSGEKNILTALIFLPLFFSCKNNSIVDLENERKQILELDAKQREYHFTKNARAFVDMFSKELISISKGKIYEPGPEKSYERFNTYFKSVEFIKWDNNTEPVIRFSDDGSIAYAAIDKTVIVKMKDTTGKEIFDTTNFAWLSVYKKGGDKWVLDCISSTNK